MKTNNVNSKSVSNGYVIYWDRVIIAAAIFLLVIIGSVSMVAYVAKGDSGENITALADKKIEGSTYADAPENQPVVEDELGSDFKVVIDAGHGGEDGGSTDFHETRIEKDDNLRLSLAVKEILESYDVEVVMTRADDSMCSLDERCEIANESDADLFVSLHRNSAEVGNGVEIWVSSKEIYEDTLLGQNILEALDEVGISENRGVQFGYISNSDFNYQVNSHTKMPSCLVELGFITNDEDNRLFDEKFDEYALAIANAIYKTGFNLGI